MAPASAVRALQQAGGALGKCGRRCVARPIERSAFQHDGNHRKAAQGRSNSTAASRSECVELTSAGFAEAGATKLEMLLLSRSVSGSGLVDLDPGPSWHALRCASRSASADSRAAAAAGLGPNAMHRTASAGKPAKNQLRHREVIAHRLYPHARLLQMRGPWLYESVEANTPAWRVCRCMCPIWVLSPDRIIGSIEVARPIFTETAGCAPDRPPSNRVFRHGQNEPEQSRMTGCQTGGPA